MLYVCNLFAPSHGMADTMFTRIYPLYILMIYSTVILP
ncbi:hypothetical protein PCIT_a0247 [Pseudoalteromonas citrea]|uniref:Uncharacterized protein n=1 Tax=Pseudoalteromonas citrea TaxID=43655 RepID=A0AAD4FSU0_9GAMM|nr:hypothetical protein PCIT_a0247 [Pseudoalteromonas citrea]